MKNNGAETPNHMLSCQTAFMEMEEVSRCTTGVRRWCKLVSFISL